MCGIHQYNVTNHCYSLWRRALTETRAVLRISRANNHFSSSSQRWNGQLNPPMPANSNCLSPSQHNTDPDAFYPNDACGNHHVGGQSKGSKRKIQQSDGRACKRLRVPSALPCRGGVPSPLFVRTSCLYHSMNVCNSSLGYSKVLCHVVCRALRRQHVKTEMRWQLVARGPRMTSNKIGVIAGRPKEA